jgi:hypothetical protein
MITKSVNYSFNKRLILKNFLILSSYSFLPCSIKASESDYDCKIFIDDKGNPKSVLDYVASAEKYDKAFKSEVSLFICDNIVTVYSPLNNDDYSDVREYFKAGKKALERSVQAGYVKPLLILPTFPIYKNGELSVLLGALSALYVPLQYREDVSD